MAALYDRGTAAVRMRYDFDAGPHAMPPSTDPVRERVRDPPRVGRDRGGVGAGERAAPPG
ncbi:hypothetical protein GCM10018781_73930 [Kitasatospora indigofera]|uniref:Uncharacterized protein n=1 Tax=Kitasatospora indigofera TaxID=67307 RepID=A0A919GHH3_9ACTN|nr:hypothetical protein GCM10018781_73930 [Kitasatospora indigofera]